MQANFKSLIKLTITLIVIFSIVGYAYYKSKDFITGPIITDLSPPSGSTVTDALLTISGTAKNVSSITLDGRPIFTNEKHIFSEKLLLYPGYNIITIHADDQFGRETTKTLEVVYRPPTATTNVPGLPVEATSTASSTIDSY